MSISEAFEWIWEVCKSPRSYKIIYLHLPLKKSQQKKKVLLVYLVCVLYSMERWTTCLYESYLHLLCLKRVFADQL